MPRKAPFYADIVRSDSPARAARATSAWGGAARHQHAGVARALWDAAGAPLCRLLQSLPAFRPLLHRTFFTLIAASILAGAHSLSNVQRKHARTHLFSVNLLPSLSHFLIVKKPSLSLSLSLSRVRFLARSLLFILSTFSQFLIVNKTSLSLSLSLSLSIYIPSRIPAPPQSRRERERKREVY